MSESIQLKNEIKILNSRLEDFQRLFKVFQSISSSLQIEKILELIISEAVSLSYADHGSIILFDPNKKQIARTLIRSADIKTFKLDNYLNTLLAGWVYDNSKLLCTESLIYTFNEKLIKEKYRDIVSVLSIPIADEKKIIGVINLVSLNEAYKFGKREIELAQTLAAFCVNVIVNANLHESLFRETKRLRNELDKKYAFREVIGNSPKLREIFSLLERIIPTEARVLIEGESGTGKELIARILHYNGPQKEGPFIAVDCGAFPENLLESELFGYVKGAFTGASQDKPGLFEEAHKGTLFLDEITNMPVNVQSKLLRALQEKEIRPLGSTKVKNVEVRIITAASDNLQNKMQTGDFREDLYYRLGVVTVRLPPLRERSGDILLLSNHFIKKYAQKYNRPIRGLKNDTIQLLETYTWPGNIRELENVIERLIILSEQQTDYIPPEVLPDNIRMFSTVSTDTQPKTPLSKTVGIKKKKAEYEKDIITGALNKTNWNQSLAAQQMDLHESTLRYKMKKLGIRNPNFKLGN